MSNALRSKKYILEYLEDLFNTLEYSEKNIGQSYEIVGHETEQAVDRRTGELLWDDEAKTVPKFRAIYDYVQKSELSDDDKLRLQAIDTIKKTLEKLI